jgi:hypothetical protein
MRECRKEQIPRLNGTAGAVRAQFLRQREDQSGQYAVADRDPIAEIAASRREQTQQLGRVAVSPQKAGLELNIEQIKVLVDLGNTVCFVASKQKNGAGLEGVRFAADGVQTASAQENGQLTLGVMVLPKGACAGGETGMIGANNGIAVVIIQRIFFRTHKLFSFVVLKS